MNSKKELILGLRSKSLRVGLSNKTVESIDEWNQLACGLLIGLVRLSECFSQQFLLQPDPVKDNRDQE